MARKKKPGNRGGGSKGAGASLSFKQKKKEDNRKIQRIKRDDELRRKQEEELRKKQDEERMRVVRERNAREAERKKQEGEFAAHVSEAREQRLDQIRCQLKPFDGDIQNHLLLPHATKSNGAVRFLDPRDSGFVNPYTFFPIESVQPDRQEKECGSLSGKLTCSLEVQEWSPLFIPNTSGVFRKPLPDHTDEHPKVHRSYDFYSYDDLSAIAEGNEVIVGSGPRKPVIPGSELRGMIRSVYEQLTNSCLPIIDEKSNPIKRTSLPKKPCRMEYDLEEEVWKLYDTEVYKLGLWHHDDEFDFSYIDPAGTTRTVASPRDRIGNVEPLEYIRKRYVSQESGKNRYRLVVGSYSTHKWTTYTGKVGEIGTIANIDACECFLHITGEIGSRGENHNHYTLFPVMNTETEVKYAVDAESSLFKRFMRVVDAYCENSAIPNHNDAVETYRTYKALLEAHEPVLVYVDDTSDPKYLAPSAISPESFDTTVAKVLEVQECHQPCAGSELCPACRLFGMVGTASTLGSRVRVTEGRAIGEHKFGKPVTLAPLSTPRPSSTEFYLRRPTGKRGMWNFDYLLQPQSRKPVSYKDLPGAGLQGRKVYLHAPFSLRSHYEEDDQLQKTSQNITVRPLRKGIFVFNVFFKELSSEELANLVYAIGGMDGRLQKLGHGRPLGMGSVFVKVEKCEIREMEYDATTDDLSCRVDEHDAEWIKELLATDERSVARRKLVTYLARNLDEVPYGERGNTLGNRVHYPTISGAKIGRNNASFKWFVNNRGDVRNPEIRSVLNTLSVEDIMRDDKWKDFPS